MRERDGASHGVAMMKISLISFDYESISMAKRLLYITLRLMVLPRAGAAFSRRKAGAADDELSFLGMMGRDAF